MSDSRLKKRPSQRLLRANISDFRPLAIGTLRAFSFISKMDNLSAIAASGMRARMQELDILANNLANSSSSGYKADREMYTLYAAKDASGGENAAMQTPWIKSTWIDLAQGTLAPTGNPLDVALTGNGFLAVRGASGTLYTRNGNLKMTSKGELVGAEDRAVLDTGGKPVKIDPSKSYEIDKTGAVTQDGKTVARLSLVEFSNPAALVKSGQSYFQADSGNIAKPAVATEIHQGQLEESNAGPAEAAVRLVSVMRQFEMLQKAVTLSQDMDKQAISEIAKVS
jgi:flagellar basal-body rod protein FlgF